MQDGEISSSGVKKNMQYIMISAVYKRGTWGTLPQVNSSGPERGTLCDASIKY